MPDTTLRQQFQQYLDAGKTPDEVAAAFKEHYGVSHKAFSPDTPVEQLKAARMQVRDVLPSYAGGAPAKSVLEGRQRLQPTLEQQLGPDGIPVAPVPQANPLTGTQEQVDDTPTAAGTALETVDLSQHPTSRRHTPKLAGGIFHPIDELTEHVWPAIKGAAQEMQESVVPGSTELKHAHKKPLMYQDPLQYVKAGGPKERQQTAVEQAYASEKANIEEKGRHHPIVNALHNLGDWVMGPAQLAGEVFLPKEVSEDNNLESQGAAFGHNLAGGLIGGTAAMLDNPAAAIYAHPVDAAALFAPAAGATLRGAPAVARLAGKVSPALEAALLKPHTVGGLSTEALNALSKQQYISQHGIQPGTPGAPVHLPLGDRVADFIQQHVPNLPLAARRWITSSVAMGDPAASAITEMIIKDPEQAASALKSIGERVANKSKQTAMVPAVANNPAAQRAAEQLLRTKWEAEVRAANPGMTNPQLYAEMVRLRQNARSIVDANIAAKAHHSSQGLPGTPPLLEGEPWLERGPTRDIHLATGTAEEPIVRQLSQQRTRADAVAEQAAVTKVDDYLRANPEIVGLVGEATKLAPGLDPALVRRALLSSLDHESALALHNPQVLTDVVKQIAQRTQGHDALTPAQIKGMLKPYMDDPLHAADHLPEFMQGASIAAGTAGVPIDVMEIIRNSASRLGRVAKADILRKTVGTLAEESRKGGVARGLAEESGRISGDAQHARAYGIPDNQAAWESTYRDFVASTAGGTPAEAVNIPKLAAFQWAVKVAEQVALGEHQPLVLPRGVSAADATLALREASNLVHEPQAVAAMQQAGTTPHDFARAATSTARSIEGYVEPGEHVVGHTAGAIHPDLNESIKWEEAARRGITDPTIDTFNRFVKGNLTARSPHSAINNFMSNTMMQSARRGNPLVAVQALNQARKYERFMQGGAVSAEDARVFRAVEQTGVLDTDLMAQDVGLMTPGSVLKKPFKMAEDVYRNGLGDNIYKLEETVHNFRTADGYVKSLKDGEFIPGNIGPNRKVTLTKSPNGIVASGPGIKTQLVAGAELDNILARMGAEPAKSMFFDYGDVGGLVKRWKTTPIVGIASPFFTWTWKAMDIPGFKKGLLSNVLGLPFGVETNSVSVAARQLADAAGVGMRRAGWANAARNDLIQNENGPLGDVVRRQPRQLRMTWAHTLGDPRYMGGYDFGKWNWAQPSQKLFAGLAGMAVAATRPSTAGMSPEQAKRSVRAHELLNMYDQGKLTSMSDALEVVGLAGSPLMDAVKFFQATDEAGKTASIQQAYQKFAGAFLTGLGRDAINVGVGALQDQMGRNLPLTNRKIESDPTVAEPFARYIIRQMTGVGYDVHNLVDTTDPTKKFTYYRQIQDEWLSSLDVYHQQKQGKSELMLAKQEKNAEHEAAARQKLRTANMLEHAVKGEVRSMYGQWYKGAKALGLKPLEWPQESEQDKEAYEKVSSKTPEQIRTESDALQKAAEDAIQQEQQGQE